MSSATRRLSTVICGAILALALSLTLAGVASAAPVGKDGKVHSCYRVKGKPKGALRVLRGAKGRCQRGERKLSWTLAGVPGAAGAAGAAGLAGADGAGGANGTAGADGAVSRTQLEERITDLTDRVEALEGLLGRVTDLEGLTARVEALEGTLEGVTNETLTGAIATVAGLTNSDLVAAVESVPVVETLCDQAAALTAQTGALGDVIEGLSLNGVLTALGGLLNVPTVPAALPEFSCV